MFSEVLTDPSYRVPAVPPADRGLAWLRSRVVRFCDGDEHARRRERVEALLATVADAPFDASPTRSLLAAFGLSGELADDVALVSSAYQPHAAQSSTADDAADRLVAACGGRTDDAAATVCALVQADAGCRALVGRMRAGSDEPPLPATRRVAPDGEQVEVALDDAHFGRGSHRCPGEQLAVRLCSEAARTAR